jgi:aminocarboxymuconate-semialdehyde decarboxylase
MITGGMAERHPGLKIAFSHGGGVLAFLVARLHRAWTLAPKLQESVPCEPAVYARRFYYDSIVFEPANLRHMIAIFGATQILAGSDFPFVMGDPDPVGFLKRCDLDAATLEAILHANAARFLGIQRSDAATA